MSDIVPYDQDLSVIRPLSDLARQLASTEFVPKGLRGRPEAVLAAMLTGRELGMQPMQSLAQINVIDGRPALSAQAMRALIVSQGHRIWADELTTVKCQLSAQRRDDPNRTHTVTWTIQDAEAAHLDKKQNWVAFRRPMLLARATGELARLAFPDVVTAMPYVSEELEDGGGFDDGAGPLTPAPDKPKPAPKPRGRTRTRKQPDAAQPPQTPPEQVKVSVVADPEPEPAAPLSEPPLPPTPAEEEQARDVKVTENMSLSQQIAMIAKEADVPWRDVVKWRTGKSKAGDVNRAEAEQVLTDLRAIRDGEARWMQDIDGQFAVLPVVNIEQDLFSQPDA